MTVVSIGFFDSDNSYKAFTESPYVPRVGEKLTFIDDNGNDANYVVTDVRWTLASDTHSKSRPPYYRGNSVGVHMKRIDE